MLLTFRLSCSGWTNMIWHGTSRCVFIYLYQPIICHHNWLHPLIKFPHLSVSKHVTDWQWLNHIAIHKESQSLDLCSITLHNLRLTFHYVLFLRTGNIYYFVYCDRFWHLTIDHIWPQNNTCQASFKFKITSFSHLLNNTKY